MKIMKKAILLLMVSLALSIPALAAGRGRAFETLRARSGSPTDPAIPAPVPAKGAFGWIQPQAQAISPVLPQPLKEWTVLVYVNGKNDLEVAGLYNLNKMELTGSGDSLNIVTEIGRMNGQDNDVHFDGDWTGSRRYYVTLDTDEMTRSSPELQSFANVDMGDWRHLVDFARWGMENFPARHYALIIWNHGSGWITSKDTVPAEMTKGISYDYETKNHISTPELGAALRAIGKVDILAYDACLMQMAELLYEVKGHADYVVGSEETVPGFGFPYDGFLPEFAAAQKSPEQLAAAMVRAYAGFYGSRKDKVTISAVRMSALPEFMDAFNNWTDALLGSDLKPRLKLKIFRTSHYAYDDNRDLYDFAARTAKADPALAGRAENLMTVLRDRLLIDAATVNLPAGHSNGLAVYLPFKGYNRRYDQLAWAGATRWDEFLKIMKDVPAGSCVDPGPGADMTQTYHYMECIVESDSD